MKIRLIIFRSPARRPSVTPSDCWDSELTHRDLKCILIYTCVDSQHVGATFNCLLFFIPCMLIRARPCESLWFDHLALTARLCVCVFLSIDICQVEFTRATDLYPHTDIDPLSLYLSNIHTHTLTHTLCFRAIIPLGMALSVAMVPLTALSRSLVFSLAALTLPFSPATLSAFSTHTHTN